MSNGQSRTAAQKVGVRRTLSNDYSIRVLFHGLLVGCFNGDGCYEVGVFNDSPSHRLRLSVWKKSKAGKDELIYAAEGGQKLTASSEARLKVYRPRDGFSTLSRFEVDGEFDRHDERTHRHDFRWIVDFENAELHDGPVRKRGELLRPRCYLENGVVFTFIRSVPLLKERKEQGRRRTLLLGRVAQVTGAYIYLAPGRSSKPAAELIVDGESVPFSGGAKYDVVLRNDCPAGDSAGATDDVVDTTQLNATFTPPARQRHFTILPGLTGQAAERMMDREVKGLDLGELSTFFAPSLLPSDGTVRARLSRQNPCGGAFFGSGSLD